MAKYCDPLTNKNIIKKADGHIVPKFAGLENRYDRTVPVEAKVDSTFGSKFDCELYRTLDVFSGKTKVLVNNFAADFDFTGNDTINSPFLLNLSVNNDNNYVRSRIRDAIHKTGELNIQYEYNPFKAKISLLYSAFLAMWREDKVNDNLRIILYNAYEDNLSYNNIIYIKNNILFSEQNFSIKDTDVQMALNDNCGMICVPYSKYNILGICILPTDKKSYDIKCEFKTPFKSFLFRCRAI